MKYDPHEHEGLVVAPLAADLPPAQRVKGSTLAKCSRGGEEIVVSPEALDFAGRNEVEFICTECAIELIKRGEAAW